MEKINIGASIDVPKLIDTRLLVQAGSGGGKSYVLRKLIESIGNKVQQIVIDPEGEFVTIREKFDFVLVGKDGDIPLSLKYAETLAHKLLETNLSAIIDLYELKHHERILFVKRFLDAMINAPKVLWHSCLVYVDEAHIFCPESSKAESMGAVIDLCTRGRKRGFAAVLATQRLSKLHKDAAAECLNKMIGRTGLDIDRKRAGDELGMIKKEESLSLRDLQPGEFFTFGPAISNQVQKFKVLPVVTTHLESGKRITTAPPTPNAVKKILSKLGDIPEEAERELTTRQQLQAEVTRLRTELTKSKRPDAPVDARQTEQLKATVTNLKNEIQQYEKDVQWWKRIATRRGVLLTKLKETIIDNEQESIVTDTKTHKIVINLPENLQKVSKPIRPVSSSSTATTIPTGEKLILNACAQYPNGLRRDQLTVICGFKRSTRDAYIQRLKEKSYLVQNGDKLNASDTGIEALGSDFKPLPEGEELQQHWLSVLPQGEKAILQVLINHHPASVPRETISEQTGFQRSTRDAYIQRMAAKEIVSSVGRGEVKASDYLF